MAMNRPPDAGEILQGTLDMLILRTLVLGPAHGHTIAEAIERRSENAFGVIDLMHGLCENPPKWGGRFRLPRSHLSLPRRIPCPRPSAVGDCEEMWAGESCCTNRAQLEDSYPGIGRCAGADCRMDRLAQPQDSELADSAGLSGGTWSEYAGQRNAGTEGFSAGRRAWTAGAVALCPSAQPGCR